MPIHTPYHISTDMHILMFYCVDTVKYGGSQEGKQKNLKSFFFKGGVKDSRGKEKGGRGW